MSDIAAKSLERWVKERGYRKASAGLGASVASVHAWVNRHRTPEPTHRQRIEDVVGIPAGQWEAADGVVGTPVLPPPEPTLVSVAAPGPTSAKAAAYAHMKDLELRLKAARDGKLGVRELALLDGAYSKAVAVYGRMSGELELTEAQITRSPAWARLVDAVFQALAKHPVAAEDVVRALEQLDGVTIEIPEDDDP